MMAKEFPENIRFQKGQFNTGLNVTVRRGDKWHGASGRFSIIDEAEGSDVDGYRGDVDVLGTLYMFFDDIPAPLLQYEHDPSCRTKKGLKAELKRVYGFGDGFSEDVKFARERWTLILFKPYADFRY